MTHPDGLGPAEGAVGTALSVAELPGTAGEAVAALGDRAVLCDLYDEAGAPVYHDLADGDTHELRELLTAARAVPGPVLDLAAGSGRITLPLLAAGREVTALDRAPCLLDLLRARLAAAPARLRERCTIVEGDMRDFAMGRRFGVVVLGTTSISLLDAAGRADLYRSVLAHLEPDGRFLLSTVDRLTDTGPDDFDAQVVTSSGRAYRFIEHWPASSGVRTVAVLPAATDADGPVRVCTTRIGVLPAALLSDELALAGLRVRSRRELPTGGWRHRGVLLEAGR